MDKSADRIVKRFDYNRLVRQTTMPIITIFNSPTDYPGKYVARVFDVGIHFHTPFVHAFCISHEFVRARTNLEG